MADTEEHWEPVRGYEGYYEVTTHGAVRSIDRTITAANGQRRTLKGKRLISWGTGEAAKVLLSRDNRQYTLSVDDLVRNAFGGPA